MDNPKLLIDTSIIIDHFRKKDKSNTRLIQLYNKYSLYISSVTVFELCKLLTENKMIEFRDIFIASSAIVNKLPLATFNLNHFARINGIRLI